MKIKTYRIHLIRHGITQGNLDGKYTGVTDYPLCREGVEALEELRREYEYPRVQKVYTSPLTRCLQTAEMLFPDTLTETVDDLREFDFGVLEDKTLAEVQKLPEYQKWVSEGMAGLPDGGEDKKAFEQRIRRGFAHLLEDMMKQKIYDAAAVTHGGIIMGLLTAYGYPRRKPLDWMVGNGKGYTVLVTPQLWMNGEVFEVFDPLPYGCGSVSRLDGYDIVDIEGEE